MVGRNSQQDRIWLVCLSPVNTLNSSLDHNNQLPYNMPTLAMQFSAMVLYFCPSGGLDPLPVAGCFMITIDRPRTATPCRPPIVNQSASQQLGEREREREEERRTILCSIAQCNDWCEAWEEQAVRLGLSFATLRHLYHEVSYAPEMSRFTFFCLCSKP